jgi:chromatin remodeling complex protein RSC6
MTNAQNDTETQTPILDENLYEQFSSIVQNLNDFKARINNLQHQIRFLEKNITKQMKGLKKEAQKNKNKGNRKPSGFAKPSKVTKELCEFMKKDEGAEIARTEVTKALVSYIKENKLENKENSKIICPDEKLKTLLSIDDAEELTYFNIQKFMNKHFVKNIAV